MKGKLVFDKKDSYKKTGYLLEVERTYDKFDYIIYITIPSNVKFNLKKIKEGFYKFEIRKLKSKQYLKDYPHRYELIKKSIENNFDLFNECEAIFMDDDIEIFEVLNSCYGDKDIFLCNVSYPITKEGYNKAFKKYHGSRNIKIRIDGNDESVSLEEYKQTLEIIDKIVNKIKKLNLSPFEEIIYAFDYTKNRYYKYEEEFDSSRESRDLTKILLGSKIVCEGYSVLFSIILQKLGYQASKYFVKIKKEKHAIDIVKFKDDKYNLDGIYYFDPTWDRKRENNEISNYYDVANLNRYNHCGNYWVSDRYEDITFGDISTFYDEELFYKIKNKHCLSIDENKRINEYISMIAFETGEMDLKNNCDRIYYETNGKSIEHFIDEFDEEKLRKFIERMSNQIKIIDNELLLRAIYNVRKIEYYENPEEFSLTRDDFYQILSGFRIYDRWYDDYRDNAHRFIDSKEQEIEKVRLTKVLSNISRKIK